MSFFSRERTIAPPGFSRWLVPPAALAIHLAIGQAYAFSVFNLPLTKLIGITQSAPGDWKLTAARLDLHHRHRLPRPLGGRCSAAGSRTSGPRKAMFAAACCFGGGFLVSALRRLTAPALAHLPRLRRARRHRPGPRLHLAGLDADQVVPRPPRHGDRHGDHGLRRRRLDRLAAVDVADAPFPIADRRSASPRRSWRMGVVYFVLHDVRRRSPSACRRRAGSPRATSPPAQPSKLVTHRTTSPWTTALQDAAVLAALGGALPERHGRHRRARPGVADDPGDVPRPSRRRSRRRASSACSACSTWAAASSGRRSPTTSAARPPTASSSCSARALRPRPAHRPARQRARCSSLCYGVII